MPRPRKHRRVWREPIPAIFKPVGVSLRRLEAITLLHEELEVLRLTDLEERYQADAVEQMGVSRSTLPRIVTKARRCTSKVARFACPRCVGNATIAATVGKWNTAADRVHRHDIQPVRARPFACDDFGKRKTLMNLDIQNR